MKKIIALILCFASLANAVEIQRSITFVDGSRLTASQLNTLIDAAIITASFYTDKANEPVLDSSDKILVYSTIFGAYRTLTASQLLYGNTNTIMSLPEKTNPATNDFVAIYDQVGTVLSRVSFESLWLGTNYWVIRPTNSTPRLEAYFPLFDGNTNSQTSLSNLWTLITSIDWTNQPTTSTTKASDVIPMWNSTTGSNQVYNLAGIITNAPVPAVYTNGDYFLAFSSTNGLIEKISKEQLVNDTAGLKFVAMLNAVSSYGNIAGIVTTTNTGFGNVPSYVRWVLHCISADRGYAVGDEVDLHEAVDFATDIAPHYAQVADTNSVGIVASSTALPSLYNKTTGALGGSITTSKWVFKVYATR